MAQIKAHGGSSSGAAGNERAAAFEGPHAFVPGGEADVFDHDVDAFFICDLADFFGNFLLVMINAVIGAKSASFFEFRFVACGRDDAAVKQLGDLNGGDAHAGASAQHQ